MDWAELVLKYLDVLAWPTVAGSALFLFRGRLRELLGRMTNAEGAGFKAEFGEFAALAAKEQREEKQRDGRGEQSGLATVPNFELDTSEPPKVEVVPPPRKTYARMRVHEITDVLTALDLWRTHDHVDLDLSSAEPSTARSVGMWVLGVAEGDDDFVHDIQLDDRRIELSHAK